MTFLVFFFFFSLPRRVPISQCLLCRLFTHLDDFFSFFLFLFPAQARADYAGQIPPLCPSLGGLASFSGSDLNPGFKPWGGVAGRKVRYRETNTWRFFFLYQKKGFPLFQQAAGTLEIDDD
jgi:hypothetical protein